MMLAADSYYKILQHIHEIAKQCGRNPNELTLVAVSKNHPWDKIKGVYDAGCRDFGENKVQEALLKIPEAPENIAWHLIGTLQKNKVRKAVGQFSLIHSVDSLSLAEKISECSEELNLKTTILLQVNTSGEKTKQGLTTEEWRANISTLLDLSNIEIAGLMTIAPETADKSIIRDCFARLRLFKDQLNNDNPSINLRHLSMGMSNDYPLAIAEGATILRIGTAIFGERLYHF